jgi:hypothetical protein
MPVPLLHLFVVQLQAARMDEAWSTADVIEMFVFMSGMAWRRGCAGLAALPAGRRWAARGAGFWEFLGSARDVWCVAQPLHTIAVPWTCAARYCLGGSAHQGCTSTCRGAAAGMCARHQRVLHPGRVCRSGTELGGVGNAWAELGFSAFRDALPFACRRAEPEIPCVQMPVPSPCPGPPCC